MARLLNKFEMFMIGVFVGAFAFAIIITIIAKHQIATEYKPITDTIYNKVVLDKIEYNIVKKDSIIYNYKTQMHEEIEQNNIATDSAVVKLFYELVQE